MVGAGLTGATVARLLADAGREVVVLERRAEVGGNVADFVHPSGIRVHRHGPHYFRTSSERVWSFVNRFAAFESFAAVVKAQVAGRLESWPVSAAVLQRHTDPGWAPRPAAAARNFEEAALSLVPPAIYAAFVREYTEKQWGRPATELGPELFQRLRVNPVGEERLTPDARYQGLPADGYSTLVGRMLAGIPVTLNCDYLAARPRVRPGRTLVFSGSIDEFFSFRLGRLPYRTQQREHRYDPDLVLAQPCGQVNYPAHADGPQVRRLEWKHLVPARFRDRIRGTVLTTETPRDAEQPDEREYPVPSAPAVELHRRYQELARGEAGVAFCGRLGEYRYLDMDRAIERAFGLADALLSDPPRRWPEPQPMPPTGGGQSP